MKSFLFVPAKEKFLKNINKTNADAIILDLEDSILEDDKKCALNLLIEAIPNIKINNKFVRINIENAENELRKLYDSDISGFMIPKV